MREKNYELRLWETLELIRPLIKDSPRKPA